MTSTEISFFDQEDPIVKIADEIRLVKLAHSPPYFKHYYDLHERAFWLFDNRGVEDGYFDKVLSDLEVLKFDKYELEMFKYYKKCWERNEGEFDHTIDSAVEEVENLKRCGENGCYAAYISLHNDIDMVEFDVLEDPYKERVKREIEDLKIPEMLARDFYDKYRVVCITRQECLNPNRIRVIGDSSRYKISEEKLQELKTLNDERVREVFLDLYYMGLSHIYGLPDMADDVLKNLSRPEDLPKRRYERIIKVQKDEIESMKRKINRLERKIISLEHHPPIQIECDECGSAMEVYIGETVKEISDHFESLKYTTGNCL